MLNLNFNRRGFIKYGLAGLGTLMVPRFSFGSFTADEPHFFLQIFISGGADSSYLFDARPFEMTAAKLMQNYNSKEPMKFTGANGTSAYAPDHTQSLLKHFDRFSILNGVHMAMTFDGHGQNTDQFFTGSPFGGESFVPHLNLERSNHQRTPVDCIRSGSMFSNTTNDGGTVPLTPESTGPLVKMLNNLPTDDGDPELNTLMDDRLKANAAGNGRFSETSKMMMDAIAQMPNLHQQLKKINPSDPNQEPDARFVKFLNDLFQSKIAQSAILVVEQNQTTIFDTHDAMSAQVQPKLFGTISDRFAKIFSAMRETAYDSQRSMLDVTTIVVSSEFSRTMRQENVAIDQTGTDHNPYTNSMIIGGKGIVPGCIFGESDYAVSTEVLSGAHKQLDAKGLRLMGRPFDMNTGRVRSDLPMTYAMTDYLNVDSVINTIYECFGMPSTMHRIPVRNGPPAPILKALLA
jgi:hypothetical protein